jgi:rhodanese-related sulfurtransferase
MGGIFVALMLLVASPAAPAREASSPGKVLHIDIRGLEILLQSDPNLMLVDVRSPEELSGPSGRISGALNISLQEIEKKPEQFPWDKTLVLICRAGRRSLKAAELLVRHGYVVYSVDGGIQAWHNARMSEKQLEGAQPRAPSAPDPAHDKGKPRSPQNHDDHSPGKNFFDNRLGC